MKRYVKIAFGTILFMFLVITAGILVGTPLSGGETLIVSMLAGDSFSEIFK